MAGAGLAGLRTVEELRASGFDGEISLIGAERRPPYDRPPLSKQLMAGIVDDTSLPFDPGALVPPPGSARPPGALRTACCAPNWGGALFDALVLATGSAGPAAGPGARTLRTLDDARAARAAPPPPGLAIAAGLIGAELATAAVAARAQVTGGVRLRADAGRGRPGYRRGTTRWYADAG